MSEVWGWENREFAEYRRARIARPFVPDVITTTLREGARRVIGATAKPLYPIDVKAKGLDRRSPKDLPLRGRGTVRRRWKEFVGSGRSLRESPHTNGRVFARPSYLKATYFKAADPYFFPIRPSYSASVFACTFSAMALLASVAAACLACVVSAAATAAFMASKSAKISC